MISLNQLTKRYGDHVAVNEVNLEFPSGEVTALIGPSGCGKSTVLRLILGLIDPSSGSVVVGGRTVNAETSQTLRREIGYVVQDGGLFPHLTAKENILLMAKHLGRDVDLKMLTGLTHFPADGLDRYPTELSGGQRQRVGLMRALALDPKILLMDEPLGALDPLVRAALQDDLKEVFGRLGKTVVLVTHDIAEAEFLSQRLVLMNEGKVVQMGQLSEMQTSPASEFVSRFLRAQRFPVTA